jgi:hypothetical protein
MEKLIHRRATETDSAALCDLMRETPMGRAIRTTQDRGNDFFSTSRLQADGLEVWAAFEETSGRAVGIFSAGSRKVFLGGEIRSIRYLSDLRICPEYRNGLLLARGFRFLKREVFADDEWAQTLILDDNSDAARLLTSGRGNLPEYQPLGQYQTWFLQSQRMSSESSFQVRTGTPTDFEMMNELQTQVGPTADFTPLLDFRTMPEVDFRLAFKREELVGIIGIWDLSAHKRTVIESYSRAMQFARPAYNVWARLRNLPSLPAPGECLDAQALTAVLCKNRDPEILRALLVAVLERPGLFAIGLDAADPLANALTELRSHTTTAGHYLVGFSGHPPETASLPFFFDFARL